MSSSVALSTEGSFEDMIGSVRRFAKFGQYCFRSIHSTQVNPAQIQHFRAEQLLQWMHISLTSHLEHQNAR